MAKAALKGSPSALPKAVTHMSECLMSLLLLLCGVVAAAEEVYVGTGRGVCADDLL